LALSSSNRELHPLHLLLVGLLRWCSCSWSGPGLEPHRPPSTYYINHVQDRTICLCTLLYTVYFCLFRLQR
jgi:hypothetical protein